MFFDLAIIYLIVGCVFAIKAEEISGNFMVSLFCMVFWPYVLYRVIKELKKTSGN